MSFVQTVTNKQTHEQPAGKELKKKTWHWRQSGSRLETCADRQGRSSGDRTAHTGPAGPHGQRQWVSVLGWVLIHPRIHPSVRPSALETYPPGVARRGARPRGKAALPRRIKRATGGPAFPLPSFLPFRRQPSQSQPASNGLPLASGAAHRRRQGSPNPPVSSASASASTSAVPSLSNARVRVQGC
jgi:hypothetical protein